MSELPDQAIVLAAGEGRRLRPYTTHTPKPLLPLLNVPLLEHVLHRLAASGVRRVAVNAFHGAAALVRWAREVELPAGLQLELTVEQVLLGTGGGIANLWRTRLLADRPVLVLAGDVVTAVDLPALADAHVRSGALATMALTPHADVRRFGAVRLDDTGRLADVADLLGRGGGRAFVNASVHLLAPAFLALLPAAGTACLVRDGYLPALARGLPCGGFVHGGGWAETGTPDAWRQAQVDALAGRLPVDPSLLVRGGDRPHPDVLVHRTAQVADDARLGGGTIVGPHARVGRGAALDGCLLLERAVVPAGAALSRRIVPAGDVSLPLGLEHRSPSSLPR